MSDRTEFPNAVKLPVPVSAQTQLTFTREAAMRGMSPQALASRCLDMIARDNLFAAVIDT